MKGQYPSIPAIYSKNLNTLIKKLLKVNPTKRGNCSEILDYPEVEAFLEKYPQYKEDDLNSEIENDLLNTIIVPKTLNMISERLPKANYNQECMNHS